MTRSLTDNDRDMVLAACAEMFVVSAGAILCLDKRPLPCMARHVCAGALVALGDTCTVAGRYLNRDHSTILHSLRLCKSEPLTGYVADVLCQLPGGLQIDCLGHLRWEPAVTRILARLPEGHCKAVWFYIDVDLLMTRRDLPWERLWRDYGRRVLAQYPDIAERLITTWREHGQYEAAGMLALRLHRAERLARPVEMVG